MARAICDRSGFEYPHDTLVRTWDGLMVHPSHWEPRHPQDFVRAVREVQTLPWARPEATDVFVATNEVTAASL